MQIFEELASDAVFDSSGQNGKFRSFREMIINYYSNGEYYRTPMQIRRDQWILWGLVRCRAWMIIPIAVVSQFCLGSLYAWSIFNKPIDAHIFGNSEANRAHITFYIALGMLGTSGAMFGPWIESHSPRMCAILAAGVFFAGHCTAALGLACKEIGMLYFGYGFIGGIGLGIGYVTTIDAVIKWYPSSRGFASGLAVSGFGSGAVAFSNINAALLRAFTVPQAFAVLGAINLVVMFLCALLMRPPPPDHNLPGVALEMMDQSLTDINHLNMQSVQQTIKGKSATVGGQTITVGSNSGDPVLIITLSQALSSVDFWLLWVAFFVNLVFGVVIISNLASMSTNMFGTDIPAPVTMIVTIEGVFNAGGRLLMGWISDWTGRRRTFLFVISLQIVIVACLISVLPQQSFWPFVVLVWLATLCYGGGVGVIAATLADMFGAPNMSACHGIMLTGWSVAAIGGGITYTGVVGSLTGKGGYTLSDPYVYVVNQYWILSLLICGWIALLLIRITPRERLFPSVRGQVFCHTFVGITIRLVRGTKQHGLHDYEFLCATIGDAGSTHDIESSGSINSTDIVPGSKGLNTRLEEINLGAHNALARLDFDPASVNNANETVTISTYTNNEPSGAKQASEAFNYVAQDRKSVTSAVLAAEGSFVQLMCSTPPVRWCVVLFNRWRLEVVSAEEVTTVWRMYLSCALLASADSEN
ncbi:hypothetical protein GGF45_001801 [Coemansia sp. RSA 551]|nr:hypothetical protein GGF45_001801 [Coemansia sp. RSA 551]KAJ2197505.1 hypothetical protein IW144_002382 [Coemansia sp. RSA 522]KAJ2275363.1 hypothetical protein J3F81_001847 [Coemansia sp. RSA 371]KAJ2403887.1 hypothetical protein J3F80_005238 [Coemansia sp. RSA 2526]KAJ2439830.1 hypothetical protein IWW46_004266 [Coemansia sp. RSA 2440]KAJ2713437.1 hypothetical protein H4S00_005443 [Coemansia sp. D1744]